MNIVVGASGQVGSAIVEHLIQAKAPVKAVVHDDKKATAWESKGVPVAIADAFDAEALAVAFQGGDAVF